MSCISSPAVATIDNPGWRARSEAIWPWSSYRSYAFGEKGAVRINQWGEVKMKIPAA
jgi:hypothetical protein